MNDHTPTRDEFPTRGDDRAAVTVDVLGPADGDEYSAALVSAVATALGLEPECLPPLTESIDPDLVESFLRAGRESRTTGGLLTFEYHGYEVSVDSDGAISILQTFPIEPAADRRS